MEEEPPEVNNIKGVLSDFSFIRGNFLIILVGWLMVDFTREMAYTYYPLFVTSLGGTATILGVINASAVITEALVKIPGGYLADHFRRKRLIIAMTLLASFMYLFYALAQSWHYLLLGAILTSFCWIYTPGFDSIIMESLPGNKRGTGYSLINLVTRVSTTPSPLIAGYLFTIYGVVGTSRIAWGLVSLTFFVISFMRWKLIEETDKPEVTFKDLLISLSNAKRFTKGIWIWNDVPKTLSALLSVELLYLIPNVMFNAVMVFYFVNDIGINEIQLAQLGTIIGVMMILTAIPAGKLIDRFGRVRPLMLGYALTFFVLPFLFDASFNRLVMLTPVIGLLNVIFYTATQALWADLIPEEKRGQVSGSKAFFTLLAVAGGNIAGGFIYDNVSHTLPIYLFMIVCLPCLFFTWRYVKEPN